MMTSTIMMMMSPSPPPPQPPTPHPRPHCRILDPYFGSYEQKVHAGFFDQQKLLSDDTYTLFITVFSIGPLLSARTFSNSNQDRCRSSLIKWTDSLKLCWDLREKFSGPGLFVFTQNFTGQRQILAVAKYFCFTAITYQLQSELYYNIFVTPIAFWWNSQPSVSRVTSSDFFSRHLGFVLCHGSERVARYYYR